MRIASFALAGCAALMFSLAAVSCEAPEDGDDGGGDGEDTAATCAAYCTAMSANCSNVAQYGPNLCLTTCATFEAGVDGETAGHTLACRAYHADAAAGSMANAMTHCPHAGPTGAMQCGGGCESFCTIVLAACTGANAQFGGSMQTCMSECNAFDKTRTYTPTATAGNDFACRMYHATAATQNPTTHCSHVATVSSTCVGPMP